MDTSQAQEAALRSALGIPESAKRVLVLQESSHWDTNWLRTSDEYFRERIEPIFEALFKELKAEPTRVFAVESVFFLKRYWEAHPERRDELTALLASGRLRLIGASLTTPDTLLPHPESVLRDYLLGQEWLRAIGSDAFPRVAYFPDNFGHSPALPSLMRAAGVEAVGVTRIDGMHFVGSDWRLPGTFPLAGSTAHLLQRELETLDFVWRDAAGAQVLCHWNAFTYFQGDMLAHLGIIRWSGKLFGVPWRNEGHIGRQLDGFVRALEPLSRTPYLFCPIGCDFNPPIEGLVSLVQRYNEGRGQQTGTHVIVAGLDDYFALLECHREKLPVLEVDPNPSWMGFYASRPELKTTHTRAARHLLAEERASAYAGVHRNELESAWELLALSNHHDFITGTSPDRVVDAEQLPWLSRALSLVEPANPAAERPRPTPREPRWFRRGSELHVQTPWYTLVFSEERGGCLTQLTTAAGEQLLRGLGLDLVLYRDSGGLWRLGHEYAGGSFRRHHRASDRGAELHPRMEDGALRIEAHCWLDGERFRRVVWCRADEPALRLRVEGLPPARRTLTCLMELNAGLTSLRMDAAGGEVLRPTEKLYSPTFWPALSRVAVGPLSLRPDAPTAVSASAAGDFEWIVGRHATKERAFGFLPVLAHPIGGSVSAPQHHDALLYAGTPPEVEDPWVSCSDERVRIGAVKAAADRRGLIVRLHADRLIAGEIDIRLKGRNVERAHLCDARERDLEALTVSDGTARLTLRHTIATLRLVTQAARA